MPITIAAAPRRIGLRLGRKPLTLVAAFWWRKKTRRIAKIGNENRNGSARTSCPQFQAKFSALSTSDYIAQSTCPSIDQELRFDGPNRASLWPVTASSRRDVSL